MDRRERIRSVTRTLVGLGAAGGALCGAVIPPGIMLVTGYPEELLMPGLGQLMAIGAGLGAVAGGVAGPVVAWGLLRHVPLGKAVLWAATGTVIGALAGELLVPYNHHIPMMGIIVGGILGFGGASIALRLIAGRSRLELDCPSRPTCVEAAERCDASGFLPASRIGNSTSRRPSSRTLAASRTRQVAPEH